MENNPIPDKTLAVNKRLALRSATALTVALIHKERQMDGFQCESKTTDILRYIYEFNLTLLNE